MRIRVLLVDDEKEFVEALAQRLDARGLAVLCAFSAEEALECIKNHPVDVVVLDMVMPAKDGMQTLREIKELRPLVEVILLTGYSTLDSAVGALEDGAFYYLTKPTDMKDLLENIANAFKRKAEHEERIRQAEIKRILYKASQV
jgi:two-component system response regulator CpxR